MKKLIVFSLSILFTFSAMAQDKKKSKKQEAVPANTSANVVLGAPQVKAEPIQLKTAKDSASYGYGLILGNSIKRQISSNADLNQDLLMKAIMAYLKDEPTTMTQEFASTYYNDYKKKASALQNEAHIKACETYMAENKKRSNVMTTASGLQYEVVTKAANPGAKPVATDRVKVHYHGTNIDGTVFDSSVERKQPAEFGLNQVIKGWTEGLQLMNVGDKFKFYIPSTLAYGERSPSQKIKPFSALVFEVELLEITSGK